APGAKKQELQRVIADANASVDNGAAELADNRRAQGLASAYYTQTGDAKKAVSYGDKAVALARDQNAPAAEIADALKTRGVAYAAARDYPRAHQDAADALKLDP